MYRLLAALALIVCVALPAGAAHLGLPKDKRVPLAREYRGRFPNQLVEFRAIYPNFQSGAGGCGYNLGLAPDGRKLYVVLDPGNDEEWGPVVFYLITREDGETVVEWAGDEHACDVKL